MLTLTFATVPKSHVLPQMTICVLFKPAAKALVSLHIWAGLVAGKWDKYQDLMCWQRRIWRVCTFAQAHLSLITVTKYHELVQLAIWYRLCEQSLNQQPWHMCGTISALYQCVKKCSQCVVIKFLNKTFASLLRKNREWYSFFGCYFMGIW